MAIVEALTAVGSAIEVAKAMRAAEKSFDAATYKLQLADLMTALSEARMELVTAREAAAERDAEFERLRQTLAAQGELVEGRGGFKYRAGNAGTPTGLPICPTCEQRSGRITVTVQDGSARKVRCPVCDARFDGVNIYSRPVANEPKTVADEEAQRQAEGMAKLNEEMRRLGRSLA